MEETDTRAEGTVQKQKVDLDWVEKIAKICSLVALPLVLALGAWAIQSRTSSSNLKHSYIQLSIDVLRDTSENADPLLRQWAAKTFAENSSIPLSDAQIQALATGEAVLPPATADYNYDERGRVSSIVYSSNNPASMERDDPYKHGIKTVIEYWDEKGLAGIGAGIVKEDGEDNPRISAIVPGLGAEKAELAVGDIILEIAGNKTNGLELEDARDLLRGPQGTIVAIKVEKSAAGKSEEHIITRKRLPISAPIRVSNETEKDGASQSATAPESKAK